MALVQTLESPFGRLATEQLVGGARPHAREHGRQRRGSGAPPTLIPVVVLADPSRAVLALVASRCFQHAPERWALTTWHLPGAPAHTRLLFYLSDPAAALQLLEEAARDEREVDDSTRDPKRT